MNRTLVTQPYAVCKFCGARVSRWPYSRVVGHKPVPVCPACGRRQQ